MGYVSLAEVFFLGLSCVCVCVCLGVCGSQRASSGVGALSAVWLQALSLDRRHLHLPSHLVPLVLVDSASSFLKWYSTL